MVGGREPIWQRHLTALTFEQAYLKKTKGRNHYFVTGVFRFCRAPQVSILRPEIFRRHRRWWQAVFAYNYRTMAHTGS